MSSEPPRWGDWLGVITGTVPLILVAYVMFRFVAG